jgi:RimJ/RimL family protein N-acetyltransferase
MPALIQPTTERLRMRQWEPADRDPFAALNFDARVVEHLPPMSSRAESDAMADRFESLIHERGWGLWALELKQSGQFIGFVGLHVPAPELPFSPAVEIGWRLAPDHWGKGLASEAARQAIHVGFTQLDLREIVSYTTLGNLRSQAVMKRLGMQRAGEFEHPRLPLDSPLRAHCLYRLRREDRGA